MDYKIKELLLKVDKPSRYCGGEFNTPVIKPNAELNFLMCFPDIYEVGHSNLGIKILYGILNNREDTACESCYAPWIDMAEQLEKEGIPLFSLETKKAANKFDMVGFSLQYELGFTNVLYMLKLSSIPLRRKDRKETDPVIIGGGPCCINPMPVADFFDIINIGDGEDVINELADAYILNKKNGGKKSDFLKAASLIEGVFVPSLNQKEIKRAVVKNLDDAYFPLKVQIPNMEAVHNRAVLEIFRGCTRGCRFCQAGMIYRPNRERSAKVLTKYFEELIINNGFDEISLSSLSTCDYSDLINLLKKIKPIADKHKVSVSLPSTRVDSFEAEFVENTRKSSITFAPEAGTQRLRDVINKNITDEDIFTSAKRAFEKGYSNIKLYFMIGLPTETQEDIEGIVKIAKEIKRLYKIHAANKKMLTLSVSTSTFVPKAFTPFQWERQINLEEINAIQNYLRGCLRQTGVKYNWHDAKSSRLETAFARGGKELGKVILTAFNNGCKFDSEGTMFNYDKWLEAFDTEGISLESYTEAINIDSVLPWDIINAGVTKSFLLKERQKAYEEKTTCDCRKQCHNCGITSLIGEECK